jgi:hypothetical protein
VLIDADRLSVDERHRQLNDALTDAEVPCRDSSDAIVIFVPKRHIETWIAYLLDYEADEEQDSDQLISGFRHFPTGARNLREFTTFLGTLREGRRGK